MAFGTGSIFQRTGSRTFTRGLNQARIVVMIENHRAGLGWELFMVNAESSLLWIESDSKLILTTTLSRIDKAERISV